MRFPVTGCTWCGSDTESKSTSVPARGSTSSTASPFDGALHGALLRLGGSPRQQAELAVTVATAARQAARAVACKAPPALIADNAAGAAKPLVEKHLSGRFYDMALDCLLGAA